MTGSLSLTEQLATDWRDIWVKALTRPSPRTFAWIARTSKAGPAQAFLWVGLASLVCNTAALGLSLRAGHWQPGDQVLFVVGPALALILFGLISVCTHGVARIAGGSRRFAGLAVSLAAFYAPMAGIAFFAFGSLLFLPLVAYWFPLNALAIKGVYALSWGRTVLVLLPVIIIGGLPFVAAALVVLLTLAG